MFANVLKSKHFCVAILLIPLLLGYIGGSAASSEPGRWQELPWVKGFESGLHQANNTDRPALIYFQARWCSWCHIFERDILGHPRSSNPSCNIMARCWSTMMRVPNCSDI